MWGGPDMPVLPECRSRSKWRVLCVHERGLHADPFLTVVGFTQCALRQLRNPAASEDTVAADHNPVVAAKA